MPDQNHIDNIQDVRIFFRNRAEKLNYRRYIEPEIIKLAQNSGIVVRPESPEAASLAPSFEASVDTNNWRWLGEELAKRMKTSFTLSPSNLDIEQIYEPTGL